MERLFRGEQQLIERTRQPIDIEHLTIVRSSTRTPQVTLVTTANLHRTGLVGTQRY
jgi:hypothetical protein